MATKVQFLAALAARSELKKVGTPYLIAEENPLFPNVNWYAVNVLEADAANGYVYQIRFYVKDEGTAEEAAYNYQKPADKYIAISDTVKIALDNYITGVSGVVRYNIVEYTEDMKAALWCIARVFTDSTGGICAKAFWLIHKNGSSAITHKVISNY